MDRLYSNLGSHVPALTSWVSSVSNFGTKKIWTNFTLREIPRQSTFSYAKRLKRPLGVMIILESSRWVEDMLFNLDMQSSLLDSPKKSKLLFDWVLRKSAVLASRQLKSIYGRDSTNHRRLEAVG